MLRLLALSLLLMPTLLSAQSLDEARVLGYAHQDDTTTFVFDEARYGVAPEQVVVTGAFRAWSQDMHDATWVLARHPTEAGLWVLDVPNPGYEVIPPATPFKFRIDGGRWLDPPAGTPNHDGGNLVFFYGVEPPRLRAELRGPRVVWAKVSGESVERPLDPEAWRLLDAEGRAVGIEAVVPNTASETLVVPEVPLEMGRVYYLELPGTHLRALCRFDGWFRTLYSSKPLGAEVAAGGASTAFRIFAPRADQVRLYLYDARDAGPDEAAAVVEMTRAEAGIWEAERAGDLHGTYYDFTVHGGPLAGEPGTYFYETHPVHISDPYARVNDGSFGKSRVWRPTTPATPLAAGRPALEDVVAYEVHVQDFTDLLPVAPGLRGTFTAMATSGLRNERGAPVGFDHLVDLGVNVVHLMPVQEFLHYPSPHWQAAFRDDPYMQEQGVALENYQWGYRTTHAFAIESAFRERGGGARAEPGAERAQFRDLVQRFHDAGLAVIVDLVPNHTGENMDGAHFLLNFNVLDKPYYYRVDENLNHIGPFGNEVKTEDRPMVHRWLIDQCRALIDEFGIDGFRIDLAGQIDEQTLRALRHALGPDVILYGEPWIPPSDPDVRAHPDWAWYKEDAPITFFQDDARNAFKGPTDTPVNKQADRGYAGGRADLRARVMHALTNDFPEERDPNQGINYLDIHDNWALADRFAATDWDGRRGVDEGPFKIAAGLLLTSLGPVVLHGGTEIMRSKGAAPLVELVKTVEVPPYGAVDLAFHGKRDTYNLRRANQFVWSQVGQPSSGAAPGFDDYAAMHAYWRGLIQLRMSEAGAAFRIGEAPPEGYYDWILPENEHLLGYVVDERVLVLVNTDGARRTFERVPLPPGRWHLVADAEQVEPVHGLGRFLDGGERRALTVEAQSIQIWVRR